VSSDAEVARALARGVAFLESTQLPSGEIPVEIAGTEQMDGDRTRDPAVFPTAVAARVLAIVSSAQRVHARALDLLAREMSSDGLWRHPSSDLPNHRATPFDLDDTSITSAAMRAAGRPVPNNIPQLIAHREPNSLFRTWIVSWSRHPFRTYRFFCRWRVAKVHDVDAVINANVVYYLGRRAETSAAIDHLLAVLRANDEMASTIWYGNPFIVWYFFSHALCGLAPEAGEIILSRVAAATPRNALELALASSTRSLWGRDCDPGPLVAAQLPSGAWPRAGLYHMGRRRADAQPKAPWWGSESLTTLFAVEALSRCTA